MLHKVLGIAFAAIAVFSSPQSVAEQLPDKVDAKRSLETIGAATLETVDLTPRFLDFYEAASRPGVDGEERWRLWKEKYGFAAVPPTPEGDAMARDLLDAAWPKYPSAMAAIHAGADGLVPSAQVVFSDVSELLELDRPARIQVVVYVGGFEGNAFTAGQDGQPIVAIPVEMSPEKRQVTFRHEMTHAVHMLTAELSGGWERSIAQTIISEGLAMHASKKLAPGRDVRAYIEHEPGWYDKAMAEADAVLDGVLPYLEASDADTVFRFTIGEGPNGLNREAYIAGWLVVDALLREGRSFAEIARIPEERMPAVVRETINDILDKK